MKQSRIRKWLTLCASMRVCVCVCDRECVSIGGDFSRVYLSTTEAEWLLGALKVWEQFGCFSGPVRIHLYSLPAASHFASDLYPRCLLCSLRCFYAASWPCLVLSISPCWSGEKCSTSPKTFKRRGHGRVAESPTKAALPNDCGENGNIWLKVALTEMCFRTSPWHCVRYTNKVAWNDSHDCNPARRQQVVFSV